MKKQELIHLHGVVAEVLNYCESTERMTVDVAEYEGLNTRPTSIHKSKSDHKDAVMLLTDTITEELQDDHVSTMTTSDD